VNYKETATAGSFITSISSRAYSEREKFKKGEMCVAIKLL
jgi:hypothetical protein